MTTTWGVCMKRCLARVLIKRGWKGVEKCGIGKGSVLLYDPVCVIQVSMVVKYQIYKLQTLISILLELQLVSNSKEHTMEFCTFESR